MLSRTAWLGGHLDLPWHELGSRFFLWNFARRYVPRVHYGLWAHDLGTWSHFNVSVKDPESEVSLLAALADLPGIEQIQDERANAILNLWFQVFGHFPQLCQAATKAR